jgi:hypothetical protein
MKIIAKTEAAYEKKKREINGLYRKANPHWPKGEMKGDERAKARDRINFEMYKRIVAIGIYNSQNSDKRRGKLQLHVLSDEELAGIKLPPIDKWIIPDECIKFHPKEFPKGVTLVLAEKCPYCEKFNRTIPGKTIKWGIALEHLKLNGGRLTTGPFIGDSPAGLKEIYRLNPGICNECANNTYQSSKQSSGNKKPNAKSGGFWDGFFEGLRGDK